MASPDFSHPRHLILAALDMAGLPLSDLPDEFLAGTQEDDFSLEFDMPGGAELLLCFDGQEDHFDLLLRLPQSADVAWRTAFALEMNRALEPHQRIQCAGPQGRIELLSCFQAGSMQAEDLALAVLDLCVLEQRFEQATPSDPGAGLSDQVPHWLYLRA
jgi:hypothetical protein